MSKLDQLYEFRLATVADIDSIMDFYKREWNPNHILATDRDFFCYQHQNGDAVNFMLAINRDTGQIEGAEGFIQYSKQLLDIGAVMWKVSASTKVPFLGVEVVKRLKQATGCRVYLGPGANPKTAVPLHQKMLKHLVGKLEHYYLLSDNTEFKIASIKEKRAVPCRSEAGPTQLKPISDIKELDGKFIYQDLINRKPFKDRWYIERRYFNYPIYAYKRYAVVGENDQISALVFAREVSQNSATILRIVDLIGDPGALATLHQEWLRLIKENHYEYIDFYCKGIDQQTLQQGGFVHKDETDPNILPNYFEPFLQQNIDIWYSLSDEDTVLFKGDGDQDRPNSRLGAKIA